MTPPTTTSVFDNEDITLAKTLVKMKDDKAKLKGVAIKEVEESDRPARSVLTLKPLLKIDPKDKGKGVLEEEPEPAKKIKKNERLIEKMNKKAADQDTSKKEKVLEEPDSTKMEVKKEEVKESTRKRPSTILKMKVRKKARKQTHADSDASKKRKGSPRMKRMSKRKKTDSDLEEEEHLKTFLKIVPDEEGIINYEVLEKRFPIINWESKFYDFDR
ncbi:hypothetical protein Tco_1111601 [Tanacetum coccineum]|uniref:Uncharacterized protein n=1 Tax=Tanacetum coccineum TaxID=301880 RepID=A0ABQ5IP92_9ASTR